MEGIKLISFIENKVIDWEYVQDLLSLSRESNQWTNFGPVSLLLEKEIEKYFPDKGCVVCSSGTSALHALVSLNNYLYGSIIWSTSAYTFPSSHIGILQNSLIRDCDRNGMLKVNDCQGYIATDIFGSCEDFSKYKDRFLIVDAAYGLDKLHGNEDCILSFHQTKPWGMGEGGCIVVDKIYVPIVRSIINFGFNIRNDFYENTFNAKLSDFSAALILSRLKDLGRIRQLYTEQFDRILGIAKNYGFKLFVEPLSTPSSVPLLYKRPILNLDNSHVVLKKYYKPLVDFPNAKKIYDRIVNFPCHMELGELSDREIGLVFEELVNNNK